MKRDIILAGVGGQGILSIAYVIDQAAIETGLSIKQAEIHGMSQRGGAVYSHLRISDSVIASDLIPLGSADLIISVEPIEGLRYLSYLALEGILITSSSPMMNIVNYPDIDEVVENIASLKKHILVSAEPLARRAGSFKAQNMVMLGAASSYLSLDPELIKKHIGELFEPRGERLVELNLSAFETGERMGRFYSSLLEAGVDARAAFILSSKIAPEPEALKGVDLWAKLLSERAEALVPLLSAFSAEIAPEGEIPRRLLALSPAEFEKERVFSVLAG
jgi:indolepyruvate ferredoxin oxidoreductase beta subunit